MDGLFRFPCSRTEICPGPHLAMIHTPVSHLVLAVSSVGLLVSLMICCDVSHMNPEPMLMDGVVEVPWRNDF